MHPALIAAIVIFVLAVVGVIIWMFLKKRDNKIKGGGLIFEDKETRFFFNEKILGVIDPKHLEELCESEQEKLFKNLEKCNEIDPKEAHKAVDEYVFIRTEYYKAFNNSLSDDVRKLHELYLKVLANTTSKEQLNDNVKLINACDSLIAKLNKNDIKGDLEHYVNTYNSSNSSELNNMLNKFKNTKATIEKVKELLANEYIKVSKSITSTDFLTLEQSNELKDILGYTNEEYINELKYLVGDVDVRTSGCFMQSIGKGKPKGFNICHSIKDDNIKRKWYKIDDLFTIYGFKQPSNTKQQHEQADVLPASVLDYYIQFILLRSFKNGKSNEIERIRKIIRATILNWWFVNILSNAFELKKFNLALSNSFIIE